MRKRMIASFVAVLVLCASVCALSACNKNKGKEEKKELSRTVSSLYVGESENFAVTVEFGEREINFLADGKVGEVAAFTEIIVTPLKTNAFEEIGFVFSAGTTTLTGAVKADEFGEFRTSAGLDFAPASVALTAGDTSETVDLQNVLEGKLTAGDVVNIAKTEFADRISEEAAGGELNREIYVKLITGDRENYYYYVSFIGSGVDYWALLVNPATGEIVSRK